MKKLTLKKVFDYLGPGLVTATMVLGPGTITVCSKAGAIYGYSLLWVFLISAIFMINCMVVSARIGCVNNKSILDLAGENYGRVWAILMGLSVFVSCAGYQTGNNIGVGVSMNAMFGGSVVMWAFAFTAISLLFIWVSKNFYDLLEKVMFLMLVLMIAAFVGNLFFISPDVKSIATGFIPSIPQDMGFLIAIAATSFSVVGAAGQSYMVQAKNWTIKDLKKGRWDATIGVIFLAVLSAVILISAAEVLGPRGIVVTSVVDMAIQLEPLLGSFAKWLFLFGLFAASFSSFLANAVLSGMFLADALGLGKTINDKWVKIFASILLLLCSCIAAMFQTNPIQLIIMAQATTCIGYPLVIIMIFFLSNNKKVMKGHQNKTTVNILLGLATVWILFLCGRQLLSYIY